MENRHCQPDSRDLMQSAGEPGRLLPLARSLL